MTTEKWHEGRMVAFDTEGTGVHPAEDRFVSIAIVHHAPGQRPRTLSWLLNPGVPVPQEAAAIHGWTDERLAAELGAHEALRQINGGEKRPLTRDAALFEVAGHLGQAIGLGVPLVVHNAPFDLTMLEAELVRHDIDTLASRPKGIAGVVDPMVIERQFDPYRKVKTGCRGGKYKCGGCGATDKTLSSLCAHYGVVHAGAHDAAADAIASLRLLGKLVAAWPEIGRWKLPTLFNHQVTWRREQSDSLRDFWKRQGDERWHEVDPGWPVQTPRAAAAQAGAA